MTKFDNNPEVVSSFTRNRKPIPIAVPESRCQHCEPDAEDAFQDNFDEDGYPIPRTIAHAGRTERTGTDTGTGVSVSTAKAEMPFRFLDLPAEVRNTIYELAISRSAVVCVPDRLLRPSEDLHGRDELLRECTRDLICLPCQLHNILRTGDIGLSRANKQLHNETALIPYTVTTFSVHDLYYLQTFLKIIDKPGREALRALRIGWKLPEEEAHALQMYTNIYETYTMLLECSCLKKLSLEIDVVNLLTWRGNGNPR